VRRSAPSRWGQRGAHPRAAEAARRWRSASPRTDSTTDMPLRGNRTTHPPAVRRAAPRTSTSPRLRHCRRAHHSRRGDTPRPRCTRSRARGLRRRPDAVVGGEERGPRRRIGGVRLRRCRGRTTSGRDRERERETDCTHRRMLQRRAPSEPRREPGCAVPSRARRSQSVGRARPGHGARGATHNNVRRCSGTPSRRSNGRTLSPSRRGRRSSIAVQARTTRRHR